VPYYNKPPQRGLFEHFKAVANKTDLPIVLYNVPSRTITSLEYETILALSEIKNTVGVKEASADMGLLHKLKKNTPTDFVLLSGDDGSYVEFLKNGGHGVISVSSHIIPSAMVNWKKWIQAGEPIKAEEDLQKYKELIFCKSTFRQALSKPKLNEIVLLFY
jgi:4-hydroxy-tetrahydrodipicolinate synthase